MLQLEGIYLYLINKVKQMKELLLLIFVLLLATYSCQNKTESYIEKQKKRTGNEKSKIISNNIIFEKDSTKDSFKISYEIKATNDSISYLVFNDNGKKETNYVNENQVHLLIKFNQQIIINDIITKNKFKKLIYENFANYQLAIFNIEEISNSGCTFFVNICVPDSDNCFTFNYTIFNDGSEKIIELENEIED